MPTVLITGATSGIGLTIATALYENGFTVFGTSRFPEKHQIKVPFRLLALDISSEESVEMCITALMAQSATLDVLINNAGILISGSAEEIRLTEAHKQLDTNF